MAAFAVFTLSSCQRPASPQATNVRYPLTAVAYLTAQTLSGSRIGCSGTVVGAEARTVITAAHCECFEVGCGAGRRAWGGVASDVNQGGQRC